MRTAVPGRSIFGIDPACTIRYTDQRVILRNVATSLTVPHPSVGNVLVSTSTDLLALDFEVVDIPQHSTCLRCVVWRCVTAGILQRNFSYGSPVDAQWRVAVIRESPCGAVRRCQAPCDYLEQNKEFCVQLRFPSTRQHPAEQVPCRVLVKLLVGRCVYRRFSLSNA